jgi:hypothetical protein
MKVRLTAEEYSEHASLCARTPARRAHLLCHSLWLPLAGSPGNGTHDPLRLGRESVQPNVACAKPARQSGASPRPAGAFGAALRSEGSFVRSKLRTRLWSSPIAQGKREGSCFGVWDYEAAGSIAAAQELAAPAAYAHAHPAAEPAGAAFTTGPAAEPTAPVPASARDARRQDGC